MAEFSPGLEGVVAAETAVSEVDGANGRLIYRGGYLIEDIVPVASYEEAAYLLWHGELPNEKELDALRHQMSVARNLNSAGRGALMAIDSQADPMDILRTVVSAQGASKTLNKPSLEEAIFSASDIAWSVSPLARERCREKLEELVARANRALADDSAAGRSARAPRPRTP